MNSDFAAITPNDHSNEVNIKRFKFIDHLGG